MSGESSGSGTTSATPVTPPRSAVGAPLDHLPALDGLRAAAVAMVVVFHVGESSGPAPGGFLGVDIFFVLSAYLITEILAREHEAYQAIDLGRFYVRRLIRLTPPLLLLLLVYVAVAPAIWPDYGIGAHWRDAGISALYLSDYAYGQFRVPEFLRHTWSLAVEEHFYLIWPFAVPFLVRLRRPHAILAAAFLAAVAWKALKLQLGGYVPAYYEFDSRLSGLLAGALLSFLLRRRLLGSAFSQRTSALAVCALILMVATSKFYDPQALVLAGTITEICSVLLIGALVSGKGGQWLTAILSCRVAGMVGKLSYGIYLWHFPIALCVRDRMPFGYALAITAVLSTAIAAVSYVSIEALARRQSRALQTRAAATIGQ